MNANGKRHIDSVGRVLERMAATGLRYVIVEHDLEATPPWKATGYRQNEKVVVSEGTTWQQCRRRALHAVTRMEGKR